MWDAIGAGVGDVGLESQSRLFEWTALQSGSVGVYVRF